MTAPVRARDVVTRTALLGVRFWDRVTQRLVTDGLSVTDETTGRAALPGPSGVFALHDLPGLRASAAGAGDAAFWASPPARSLRTIAVADAMGRFQPLRFDATVPVHGVLAGECPGLTSPLDSPVAALPLFSAPARPLPGGAAVVRADLVDATTGRPAAWAVLEVTPAGGATYRGVAGAGGSVVVVLPYPEPSWHGTSPPAGSRALGEQAWPVTVDVRFTPGLAGAPPDLCDVLGQAPATALAGDSPADPLLGAALGFGRELVLRTAGHSVLEVLPA